MVDFLLLAGNTADGFSNYFSDILNDKYVYCIKGGSGVGKSTFMKEIAKISTLNGINILQVPCSSDINSLDMLVLPDRNIAFVDATSPHSVEPSCYGAKEVIVNLGDFLDCKVLKQYDKELLKLVSDKSVCYKNCYNALRCSKIAEENVNNIYNKWLKDKKIKSVVNDIFKKFIASDIGSKLCIKGYLEYLTADGIKTIFGKVIDNRDIISIKCNNKYCSSKVLNDLLVKINAMGIATEKYYSIYNTKNLIALGVYNYIITTIDVDNYSEIYDINEMYDNVGIKNDLNQILSERKIFDFSGYNACNYFAQSRAIHNSIEEYYIKAMDFDKWEEFKKQFIDKIDEYLH